LEHVWDSWKLNVFCALLKAQDFLTLFFVNLLEHAGTLFSQNVLAVSCSKNYFFGDMSDVALKPPMPAYLQQLRQDSVSTGFVTAEILSHLWEETEYWFDVCHVMHVDKIECS
jgi:hypothetical protein